MDENKLPSPDFENAFDTGANALADAIAGCAGRGLGPLLSNPVVRAMIAADGVGSETLTSLLQQMAAKLGLRHTHKRGPASRRLTQRLIRDALG
jgi:hypothetical protein